MGAAASPPHGYKQALRLATQGRLPAHAILSSSQCSFTSTGLHVGRAEVVVVLKPDFVMYDYVTWWPPSTTRRPARQGTAEPCKRQCLSMGRFFRQAKEAMTLKCPVTGVEPRLLQCFGCSVAAPRTEHVLQVAGAACVVGRGDAGRGEGREIGRAPQRRWQGQCTVVRCPQWYLVQPPTRTSTSRPRPHLAPSRTDYTRDCSCPAPHAPAALRPCLPRGRAPFCP